MKKSLLSVVAVFAFVGVSLVQAEVLPASADVKQVAESQARGVYLLDVREPDEFAEVHAKGAVLIPLGQLSSRLDEIAQYKNKPVAVICRSGRRSAQGVEILRKAGFTQLSNVTGGTSAWVDAGLPVIRK